MLGEGGGELGPGASCISVGRLAGTAIPDARRKALGGGSLVTVVAAPRLISVGSLQMSMGLARGWPGVKENLRSSTDQWHQRPGPNEELNRIRNHEGGTNLSFPLCRQNRCPSVMANGLEPSPFGLKLSACAPIW